MRIRRSASIEAGLARLDEMRMAQEDRLRRVEMATRVFGEHVRKFERLVDKAGRLVDRMEALEREEEL